jgi:hypothetical protein
VPGSAKAARARRAAISAVMAAARACWAGVGDTLSLSQPASPSRAFLTYMCCMGVADAAARPVQEILVEDGYRAVSAYFDQRDTAALNSSPWRPFRDGDLDTAAGPAGSALMGDGHGRGFEPLTFCMPYKNLSYRNVAGYGPTRSFNRWTSPGIAGYRWSLAPRLLPRVDFLPNPRRRAIPNEFIAVSPFLPCMPARDV